MKRATQTDADLAAWCAALACHGVDKVPHGWVTVTQLADELGKAEATIRTQLSRAVREGRAEMQKFRIQTPRGPYPVPHYRLK